MPNKQIQSLTVEGVTYDIVDNTSGYINVQYIENKTDYSIPVSRAGEIIAGETAIGTDSTNFPTSKAVVDYVDERVVQEMDAIDVGVTGIKANGTSLPISDGVVNIPAIGPNQSVGLITENILDNIYSEIPTSTSQLTNDSGYLTASDIASVMTYKGTKANYTALPSTGNITGDVWHLTDTGAEWAWDGSTWQELGTAIDLSGYATKATTLAGYGITDAKIQNGTITLGSNTITPLTSFTETDPVFSASAAAGITSEDIAYWNSISNTDYQLQTNTMSTSTKEYIVVGPASTTAGIKYYNTGLSVIEGSAHDITLTIGTASKLGQLQIINANNDKYALLSVASITSSRTITLPDKSGTIALTSDIPDTSSFLTSETDPVFSASAAAGITSSNITSWNGKIDTAGTGLSKSGTTLNHSNSVTAQTTSAVYPIKIDAQGHISEYGSAVTITDENLAVDDIGSTSGESLSYLIFGNGTMAQTRNYDTKGLVYRAKYGTGSSDSPGWAYLTLGNGYGSTTAGNKQGKLILYGSTAYAHTIEGAPTAARTLTLPNKTGTVALTSDIPDVSGFVSDDKTWNGVTLNKSVWEPSSQSLIPHVTASGASDSYYIYATSTPGANRIAKYDSSAYLKSITPSANDNSTKVATTAYVDTAIPKVYSSTNTGGYLTMATLPIYDGTVV